MPLNVFPASFYVERRHGQATEDRLIAQAKLAYVTEHIDAAGLEDAVWSILHGGTPAAVTLLRAYEPLPTEVELR